MYSGSTLRDKSGHTLGVHQRIDRLARRSLRANTPRSSGFPLTKEILHFEGNHGPDGLKRKSPGHDEPWHEIDPMNPDDTKLYDIVDDHLYNLRESLRSDNHERAAFEAAWLAHAITDGLTPAHQYPLSTKIEELWGKPHYERQSLRDKMMITGDSRIDTFVRNWKYWGAKGIFATHFLFEWGVATSISTYKFSIPTITETDLRRAIDIGFRATFEAEVKKVYRLAMYEEFWRDGWTTHLGRVTRKELVPIIVRTVALAWLIAFEESKH